MKFKSIIILVVIAGSALLISSFLIPQNKKLPEEATTDFSFIRPMVCISELFDKEQWRNNTGRSFDKDGIHLTNDHYNPVNICHYALFCFDAFKRTGDEEMLKCFKQQVHYLVDSNYYHQVDIDKIAYPYNFNFHDLKAPWYSALAQSEAILVLVREYSMTKDKNILPLIRMVMNFMLAPQDGSCGTMSKTPEGNEWYEEYPVSKQEKQVFNGFMISIGAMYEYSKLFPNDTEIKTKYEKAVKTAKESFKFYDTGSWLRYNRGDQRQVSNGYMKWQVLEMKYLYQLTGDIFFRDLMMLISSYCYNKPFDTPGCKVKDYDFSIPLSETSDGSLEFTGKNALVDLPKQLNTVTSSYSYTNMELTKLYDNSLATYLDLFLDTAGLGDNRYVCFSFKSKQILGSVSITFPMQDSVDNNQFTLAYKDTITDTKWRQIRDYTTKVEGKCRTFNFKTIKPQVFWVFLEKPKKLKKLQVNNIAFFGPSVTVPSDFWHYITPTYTSQKGPVSLNFDKKSIDEFAIFYKASSDLKKIDAEKWDVLNPFRTIPVKINRDSTTNYRFLIICKPKNGESVIKNVRME